MRRKGRKMQETNNDRTSRAKAEQVMESGLDNEGNCGADRSGQEGGEGAGE